MRISLKGVCLLTGILLAGCKSLTPATTSISPTSTVNVSQISPLTLDQLKNYPFLAPQYNQVATLKDGSYQTGSGADIFSAVLQPEVAFGDLNRDGVEDTAVLLAENGGGTGVFVSLIAFLNENGVPMQAASVMVDDRPIINSLTISDGKILLGVTIHGPNDPMVNPTEKVSETFQLLGIGMTNLVLTHFVSNTPDGSERSITIDSPKGGDLVSGFIRVQGSMPIAPFENTLAYRIYDESGNKLAEGPFMVNSGGVGGPASFDASIDISALPKGIVIRLELVDVSMADGSTLALDSVELVIP
jgi:hypothetical protein